MFHLASIRLTLTQRVSLCLGVAGLLALFTELAPIGFWQGVQTYGPPALQYMCKSMGHNHSKETCEKETVSFEAQAMQKQIAAMGAKLELTKTTVTTVQSELAETNVTLQAELARTKMTLQAELAATKGTLAELEQALMTLQAELARTKKTLQAELARTKATLAEVEEAKMTLQTEVAQTTATNQRHEAVLAELLSHGTALSSQKPTGVYKGQWGNAGTSNTEVEFSMRMDASTFLYHGNKVTGEIKYTVTKHSWPSKFLGAHGSQRFTGVWDAKAQTIIGHGVSVTNSLILAVSKKILMNFTGDTVEIVSDQATSVLTTAAKI